ncbi:helix-turn-helix domain-containing protein [Mesorhizobium helmanticense]|uniref:Transcriptional regulator n=1 Tax=Mesorhizobium helmanticense TaxID=1776423 RepID=A0A2T4IWU1_9HYPH|nr:helix-turn-helix transcriptional regulator [Mesorhizobium helmanticense]PTE10120.1 transcriptional regulator [Mesorhizobium helmanticense]
MHDINQLTGRQIAAARALLGLSQTELAEQASISAPTLRRMEASTGHASGYVNNVIAVRQALESAGISFLADGETVDGGPGVRLRQAG